MAFIRFVLVLAAVITHTLALSDDLQKMLAFTQDWFPKDPSWTAQTKVCSWYGVECDSNGRVTGFNHNSKGCNGTLNISSLPSGMQRLDLSVNQFTGTPDLSSLPSGMQQLYLYGNKFCGATDTNLPCAHFVTLPVNTTCNPLNSTTSVVNFPPCG